MTRRRFEAPAPASFTRPAVRALLSIAAACLLVLAAAPAPAEEKPSVLLLPFQVFAPEEQHAFLSQGLRSMFVSRLSGEGLNVLPDSALQDLLTEADRKGVSAEERARELGSKAGAAYTIFGTVTAFGGGYSLDLGILDFKKAPPKLTRVSEATQEDRLIPKLADVAYEFRAIIEGIDRRRFQTAGGEEDPGEEGTMGLFFTRQAESYGFEPTGYVNMRGTVVSFDTGDLDGDGTAEIVMATTDKLYIASRDGDTLVNRDYLEARTGELFLRVSVGDMDGNGRSEIYLVSLYGKRAQTSIYGWEGQYRVITREYGHLNVVKDPSLGKRFLFFQNSLVNRLFAGDIHYMELGAGGSLKRLDPLPIENPQFYTLAAADVNADATIEFVGLNERGYLHLWTAEGTVLWRGDAELGGSNTAVIVGDKTAPDADAWQTEISGRLIVADIDDNGTREVIVPRNIAVFGMIERLNYYKTSRVLAYQVDGTSLNKAWATRTIKYAIADLQQEGGTLYIAGQEGKLSKISTGKSRIMWFE
jgi:TolB-like protein